MVNTKLQCKVIKQLIENIVRLGGCPICAVTSPKLREVAFDRVGEVRISFQPYELESDDPETLEEGLGEIEYQILDEKGELLYSGDTHVAASCVEVTIKPEVLS